jgi:hypothetical protein
MQVPHSVGAWFVSSAMATLLATTPLSAGQEGFSRAKQFYEAANYEEALALLTQLQNGAPATHATELASYEVFCLLALGRSDEATHAIESIVRMDPLYHPSEAQVSPRVRAFFEEARRPLLSDVVRKSYSSAKAAFDSNDKTAAAAGFDRVIALIDEIGPATEPGVADLRTLSSGFRELSKMAIAAASASRVPAESAAPSIGAPPVAPTPAATAVTVPALSPAAVAAGSPTDATVSRDPAPDPSRPFDARDAGISPPIALVRTFPPWRPVSPLDAGRPFKGSLELVVDDAGVVASARMVTSVNATYDPVLMQAARKWTFRPATKNGVAVPYRVMVDVQLNPTSAR